MIAVDTIKQASTFTLGLYDYDYSPHVDWNYRRFAPVCWALKRASGIDFLIFRGSVTAVDWERDFEAMPIYASGLDAHVHPGFHEGIEDIVDEVLSWSDGRPMVVAGHSLGAARSAIAAAYAIRRGMAPLARIAWGEPRPGFADLARLLAAIPNYNFVNGNRQGYDLVTDVPFSLPFAWYCAGAPHLFVDKAPAADDEWGPFRYHHMRLYDAAMQSIDSTAM